ncbi:MAG: hypothetical protein DME89_07460 [Verrucomicrobia bacterium]|nr:MAG: hypothetical protein DME89_07460 [Verrucomicrobiota bacterium]
MALFEQSFLRSHFCPVYRFHSYTGIPKRALHGILNIFLFIVLAFLASRYWEVIFGRSLVYCPKSHARLRGKFGNR